MKKRMIWYTGTERNTAVQAVESGTTFNNISDVVIFSKQREAEKYAAVRDGGKKSGRKF